MRHTTTFDTLLQTIGPRQSRPHGHRRSAPAVSLALTLGLAVPATATLGAQTSSDAPAVARAQEGTLWPDRPSLSVGKAFRLDLHARIQSQFLVQDGLADPDASTTVIDRLSLQRGRVGASGVIAKRVAFQLEREVSGAQSWRDAFADVEVSRALHVRAGQFKVPFSREQLTSMYDLDFTSRSAAVSELVPLRSVGFMAHGVGADRAVRYEAGVFEHDRQARVWDAGAPRVLSGRVTVSPLKAGRHRGSDTLQLSGAWLRNPVTDGRTGPSGHFALGKRFFEPLYANGRRTLVGLGAAWQVPVMTVAGEWLQSAYTRQGQALDGGDLSDLQGRGGYASAAWHLVHGKGRRRGHAPFRELSLTGRFDWLHFESANTSDQPFRNPRADHVAPLGKRTVTAGLTWHLNRWMTVHTNAIREQVVDPLSLYPVGHTPAWSAVLRSQVEM
jgi:phosphate-selective porin